MKLSLSMFDALIEKENSVIGSYICIFFHLQIQINGAHFNLAKEENDMVSNTDVKNIVQLSIPINKIISLEKRSGNLIEFANENPKLSSRRKNDRTCKLVGKVEPNLIKTWEQLNTIARLNEN